MVKPYLNQVGGKVENDVSLFTGGLNTYVDKAFINSNQMPYVMNMTMYKPPMMCTRPARKTIATQFGDNPLAMNIGDIKEMWSRDDEDVYFITDDNGTLRLKRYRKENGVFNVYTIGELPSTDKPLYFCYVPISDVRYIYIGNEDLKARYDMTNPNPLSGDAFHIYNEPGDDDHYGIPVWHKARLWLARPTENVVEWSNPKAPDDFLQGYDDPNNPTRFGTAGELYVTNHKGDLKTIVSFDDKLMILCEHSIHAVYGDDGNAESENFFQQVDIINNLGIHSARCLAVGGGRMFWLGDDYEVYEYTGSYINMISRPDGDERAGGISNIFTAEQNHNYKEKAKMVATSSKLFFNIGPFSDNEYLFVYDIYNKIWWCEDGNFVTIANFSDDTNQIIMALPNHDMLVNYEKYVGDGVDLVYDFEAFKTVEVPIEYEFHTRVYGADGTDSRKTISEIIFQARATATVFINDIWTSFDKWEQLFGTDQFVEKIDLNYRPIGTLSYEQQSIQTLPSEDKYRPNTYEQQHIYIEKMLGQRLNAFQIIVKGRGASKFYLMKREWRAR